MINNLDYINGFRELLLQKNEAVGELEMTNGNYDEKGKLITKSIPTITTDYCEIGKYGNIIYFVFVVDSSSYNSRFYQKLITYSNAKVYGFTNFNETLYPMSGCNDISLKTEVIREKYFQVQYEFGNDLTVQEVYEQYMEIKKDLLEGRLVVVNQMEVNLQG